MIAAQAAFPLVRGIRSKPVTAPSPDRIEPGAPGTMQDERWLRGFALLEKYGLSWDLRVPFWHLAEAAEVARAFPNTPIVLNHTGFPWDRSDEGLAAWRRQMEVLAREPNVHVKVSEFGLKDQAWDYEVEPSRGARRAGDLRGRAGDVCDQFPGRRAAHRLRGAGRGDEPDAGPPVAGSSATGFSGRTPRLLSSVTAARIKLGTARGRDAERFRRAAAPTLCKRMGFLSAPRARLFMQPAASIHWQAKTYVGAGRAVAAAGHRR